MMQMRMRVSEGCADILQSRRSSLDLQRLICTQIQPQARGAHRPMIVRSSAVPAAAAPAEAPGKVEGIATDITKLVGNTPMVFLNRVVGKVKV